MVGAFSIAMGGVVISTCPLDVIDLDTGSKKDPVLKIVLSLVSWGTSYGGCRLRVRFGSGLKRRVGKNTKLEK